MSEGHEVTFRSMIEAHTAGDRDTMAASLSDSLVAYVINADGRIDELWMVDALPVHSDGSWA